MKQGFERDNQRWAKPPRPGPRLTYGVSIAFAVIVSAAMWWMLYDIWTSVQGMFQ